jgi:ribosomal protein S15P/S13E
MKRNQKMNKKGSVKRGRRRGREHLSSPKRDRHKWMLLGTTSRRRISRYWRRKRAAKEDQE